MSVAQPCAKRSDKIEACFVPLPERSVKVFVVTKSPRFDFDFMEEITALELALHDDGWRIDIWQLPATEEDSTGAFFNKEGGARSLCPALTSTATR